MTALAKEVQKTPMSPYLGLLQKMTPEEKKIVIMFLTESLAESKVVDKSPRLSKEERKRGLIHWLVAGLMTQKMLLAWRLPLRMAAKTNLCVKSTWMTDGEIHS